MVSGHLVDMVYPNLIEAFQNKRCLCIGVLCVSKSGIAHTGEASRSLCLRLIRLCLELTGNVDREVVLLTKHLDAVQHQGHLVALFAHGLGEVLLHGFRIASLLFGQQAGDRLALFLGQLVGVSRSRIGQCRLAKHEATVLDVIPRTLSSGVCIQGHELTQSQFELLAGVVEELSVDFLIDIPVVEAILLDHLVTESSRLHDILHDGVLRIGNVHHQRGECLRTDAIQRIVELLIVPTDLVGKISGNDTSLLIRDLPTAEVTCDSSDPLLDGFGNTLDMELIRISHIGQHHGICTIQPIKLLCGHVCHTHILQDSHPILIAHEGSQGILQHFIVCSLDGILLGILEACVLGHQIVEQIVHRGVEPFVSLCLQQVTELVLVRLALGI